MEISKATAEMPEHLTSFPAEVELVDDGYGMWCLLKPRIRAPLAKWKSYEEFLKTYQHIVEGGVKEMYKVIQISGEVYVHMVRAVLPTLIGFKNDPQLCMHEQARALVLDNAAAFEIIRNDQYSNNIPLVLNPCLADLFVETQRYINDEGNDGVELRNWVARFVAKKDQNQELGIRPIYGENNVRWYRCPHPRLVGIWLNVIPNANMLSVPYTLKFIGPRISTKATNTTAVANALQVKCCKRQRPNQDSD